MAPTEPSPDDATRAPEDPRAFAALVYRNMALGAVVTATVAATLTRLPALLDAILLTRLRWAFMALLAALAVVFSQYRQKLSPAQAGALFFSYASLFGLLVAMALGSFERADFVQLLGLALGAFLLTALLGHASGLDLRKPRAWFDVVREAVVVTLASRAMASQGPWFEQLLALLGTVLSLAVIASEAQSIQQDGLVATREDRGRLAWLYATTMYLHFFRLLYLLYRLLRRRPR
ncbi:MAG: Bax inhibitor-1 family protein [Deltaproteobacteria bacterium]|nr:Bax inhibitor-1 family protein [Deltaproteobacteria bacterium]